MALNIGKAVLDFLTAHPDEKFSARQIAEWIFATFPEECQAKKANSQALDTDTDLLQQLVAEIGSRRPVLQKKHPGLKITEGRPRKYYFSEKSDSAEVAAVESGSGSTTTGKEDPKLGEHGLYPLLSTYLWAEFGVYSKRIDEKRSSNKRGPNGNRWLYPDLVGMEDLGSDWHQEVKDCVNQYSDKRTKLWSFEVKLLINRSNVREAFFQAVSNSSWSNFGYLVAGEIEGQETLKELRATLSPRETAALSTLGKAIKPTTLDPQFVLCPHCQQHRAQVWGDGHGERVCRCPDCGPVTVEADDVAALTLDEDWLRQKMRLALGIESRDGIDDLGDGVWRLGDARRSPVLLARDLTRVWQEPALLDRVRVAGGDIRVISPRPRTTRGSPFGIGVEWLALEERFTFYGGGISFIGSASPSTKPVVDDPATTVNGPFSADFKWATLPDGNGTPIRFTDGQAKVFAALWSFKGGATTAERIMQRAGLDSAKPSDLFKIKQKDKGKPEPEAQHAAYGALVVTQQRAGLYSMPCAAGALA